MFADAASDGRRCSAGEVVGSLAMPAMSPTPDAATCGKGLTVIPESFMQLISPASWQDPAPVPAQGSARIVALCV